MCRLVVGRTRAHQRVLAKRLLRIATQVRAARLSTVLCIALLQVEAFVVHGLV